MKKKGHKIKYTDEAIEAKVIKDFLPAPHELVLKDDGVKVTLELSAKTVKFFKEKARKYKTGYQPMIRSLLDQYTQMYE